MVSNNGPYVWWMKDYKDKVSAGQVEASQFLIYQSTTYNPGYWAGRWFFEGDEFDRDYSGTWSLGSFNSGPQNRNNAYEQSPQQPIPAKNLYYPTNTTNTQNFPPQTNTYQTFQQQQSKPQSPYINPGYKSPTTNNQNPFNTGNTTTQNPFDILKAQNNINQNPPTNFK